MTDLFITCKTNWSHVWFRFSELTNGMVWHHSFGSRSICMISNLQPVKPHAAEAEAKEHDVSLANEEKAEMVQLDYALAASVHGHCGKGGGKLSIAEVEDKAVENCDYHGFQERLSITWQSISRSAQRSFHLLMVLLQHLKGFHLKIWFESFFSLGYLYISQEVCYNLFISFHLIFSAYLISSYL